MFQIGKKCLSSCCFFLIVKQSCECFLYQYNILIVLPFTNLTKNKRGIQRTLENHGCRPQFETCNVQSKTVSIVLLSWPANSSKAKLMMSALLVVFFFVLHPKTWNGLLNKGQGHDLLFQGVFCPGLFTQSGRHSHPPEINMCIKYVHLISKQPI